MRSSLSMQHVRFVRANFRAHLLWALFYGMKSRTLVKLLSIVLRGKMYDFVCDYVRDEVAKCLLCVGFFFCREICFTQGFPHETAAFKDRGIVYHTKLHVVFFFQSEWTCETCNLHH